MRVLFGTTFLAGCALSGCSSSDSNHAISAGDICANATLAVRRDTCEFKAGALAKDTVGDCTGATIPIEHIVVIMQENRSFDHYFGHLPGNGQDDVDVPGTPPTNPDPTGGAAIAWHHESAYCVEDTDHGWNASHQQWDNGKNDGFTTSNVTTNDPSGHRAMGYYDATDLPFYYKLASTFAISDTYFCSLLGSTYPNRMFSVAGTSFGIITTTISKLAPAGSYSVYQALTEKGVSWKDYATDLPSTLLFHDYTVPLQQTAPEHFTSADQFVIDAQNGQLAQVSFLDAGFEESSSVETDEHPPADLQLGQHYVWEKVMAVMNGPQWPKTAIFITYDEHGGLYDHVKPPAACAPDDIPPDPTENPVPGAFDRLGFRVPMTIVSPYARRHFVSHVVHSHTSMLRFIEAKFDLPAMTARDANSDALFDMFDFSSPNTDVPTLDEPPVDAAQIAACQTNFP